MEVTMQGPLQGSPSSSPIPLMLLNEDACTDEACEEPVRQAVLCSSWEALPTSLVLPQDGLPAANSPNHFVDEYRPLSLTKRSLGTALPNPSPKRRKTAPALFTPDSLSALQIAPPLQHVPLPSASPTQCKWGDCALQLGSLKELGRHLSGHIKQQKGLNRSNKKSGYVCQWAGCTRTTAFKGCYNLEHHLRYQHTGEKPYECEVCHSSFAQKSDLNEHMQNIHDVHPQRREARLKSVLYGAPAFVVQEAVDKTPAPRSHPIPILPAPQEPYGPSGGLRSSSGGLDWSARLYCLRDSAGPFPTVADHTEYGIYAPPPLRLSEGEFFPGLSGSGANLTTVSFSRPSATAQSNSSYQFLQEDDWPALFPLGGEQSTIGNEVESRVDCEPGPASSDPPFSWRGSTSGSSIHGN